MSAKSCWKSMRQTLAISGRARYDRAGQRLELQLGFVVGRHRYPKGEAAGANGNGRVVAARADQRRVRARQVDGRHRWTLAGHGVERALRVLRRSVDKGV